MKDLINKGKSESESALNAELFAFRDLVSRKFDNADWFSETDTGEDANAPGRAASEETVRDQGPVDIRSNVHLSDGEVQLLAANALSVLSAGIDGVDSTTPLASLYSLTEAYLDHNEYRRHDTLARVMSKGVSAEDIIESVVPDTARYMGELWAHDKLSFADVTIGTARLQETVRTIGDRSLGTDLHQERPSILLVVPRVEQHTLGIFVLAEQFRRLGVLVHLTLGNNPAEIVRLTRKHGFAMVGISASSRRTLASVRELVKTIRSGILSVTPIVVGGPVTCLDVDIKAMTGADHVTSDAEEALSICGIVTTKTPAQLL
ncbi:MAG: cobalamin B12-binding domain-containing protein [Dinoroseobacter sp.]|nr:cobalamin B12-binding domain-containing protein [Dinoroseobacter sp.]MDJ0995133.1 cobalamin B12-binding domain-containing protein [Dinoroseobacter sp.]